MGKLIEHLQKQLQINEYKKDAEDCLKMYEKIKEMNDGHVWESQWASLVLVRFEGDYPNHLKIHKPSSIGYVFLKGIESVEQTNT